MGDFVLIILAIWSFTVLFISEEESAIPTNVENTIVQEQLTNKLRDRKL